MNYYELNMIFIFDVFDSLICFLTFFDQVSSANQLRSHQWSTSGRSVARLVRLAKLAKPRKARMKPLKPVAVEAVPCPAISCTVTDVDGCGRMWTDVDGVGMAHGS